MVNGYIQPSPTYASLYGSVLMKYYTKITSLMGVLAYGPPTSTIYCSHNPKLFTWLLLTLLSFQLFNSRPSSSACSQSDRDSILFFFNSLSVSPPLNWSSSADCCSWEGIYCETMGNGDEDRVTQLLLSSRGLKGVIPPSLTNLTYLSRLDLSNNRLNGSLPLTIFTSLHQLQLLNLSHNSLSGQLPMPFSTAGSFSYGVMKTLDLSRNYFYGIITSSFIQQVAASGSLISFNISSNSFTGPIPTSLCFAAFNSSLRELDLSSNEFNGTITLGLGQCSNLVVFRAGFNKLSGPIPSDLYDSFRLEEISLPLNNISGTISDDIFRLKSLKILELYSNQLSGYIPEGIGKLSELEEIYLHINNLNGTIPFSLMNCTSLTILNLRVNSLQGDLSALDFSKLLRLKTVDLGNNKFTGSIPPTLYSCTSLKAVRLTNNMLTGEILPSISTLQSLSFLSLSKNNLSNLAGALRSLVGCKNLGTLVLSQSYFGEELPDGDSIVDANSFQKLQVLALGACNLFGRVPSWIINLQNMEALDLSSNQLIGTIPGWLGNLPRLFYIDLSNNNISGEFPKELCNLQALVSKKILDQATKSFLALPVFVAPNKASIPNQLSSLPHAIYLENNTISGSIPSDIGQLKFIEILDLSHNNFFGGIPNTISNLINLERLDLSNNNLTGQIPTSLRDLYFLSWFSVAYNNLEGPIPIGGQFDTFPSSSFEGNPGLCSPGINQRYCVNQTGTPHSSNHHKGLSKKLAIAIVFGICLGEAFIIAIVGFWILTVKHYNRR